MRGNATPQAAASVHQLVATPLCSAHVHVPASSPTSQPPSRVPRSDIVGYHRRLAEIIEMIHTASLVHDDVLDNCSTRRGARTRFACHLALQARFLGALCGTRVAVLVGDFLFAQSSWYLANLDNLEVIKLISQVGCASGRGRPGRLPAARGCSMWAATRTPGTSGNGGSDGKRWPICSSACASRK